MGYFLSRTREFSSQGCAAVPQAGEFGGGEGTTAKGPVIRTTYSRLFGKRLPHQKTGGKKKAARWKRKCIRFNKGAFYGEGDPCLVSDRADGM